MGELARESYPAALRRPPHGGYPGVARTVPSPPLRCCPLCSTVQPWPTPEWVREHVLPRLTTMGPRHG